MTGTLEPTRESRPPLPAWAAGTTGRPGLERHLEHLDRAIDGARTLGLPTDGAERVRDEAAARLGFPADVYVLALVGGTGVGKSSLLNALAGEPVSRASVRRPTTDEPVAWVPAGSRAELGGLLDWLGVDEVGEHADAAVSGVAILDLPDMDSVEPTHRERVEAILPRVDAVAWVTDPEKYHDAVLHDEFLHEWLARLHSQVVIVNKSDRLALDGIEQVRRDLQRDLGRLATARGGRPVPVLVASATTGPAELREVRDWLAGAAESKRIVRARLVASMVSAVDDLAEAAGVDPRVSARPFLEASRRRAAVDAVTAEVLRAIDLPGLERQAIAATRARARARGTGPIGLVTSLLYRLSGREARVADPGGYLVRWRDRGPLAPAVDALRSALVEPVQQASPAVRPALAASVAPEQLRSGLEAAVDRAVARHDRTPPTSWLWTLLGMLQTVATFALALSVVWIIVWILARPPIDTIQLPVIGGVPSPLVALAASLVAGYLVARILGIHAGWRGRRWAASLRDAVKDAIHKQIAESALTSLDRLEYGRRTIWAAARAAWEDARRI
ncbi:MAG TPA: GTPase [Clostridia bacterium]|nr:GTPase [Clostridia bacterium]